MSPKRMRTQSSAAAEPANTKKPELEHGTLIGQGGRAHDYDEPDTKPLSAKDREKLGMTVGSTVYCGFEIAPLYPSFFRPEVVFSYWPCENDNKPVKTDTASPSPAPTSRTKYGNHAERLYICETCFKYTSSLDAYLTHANDRCLYVHAPPGKLVYLSPGLPNHPTRSSVPYAHPRVPPGFVEPKYREKPGYALYEIDGDEHKLFCQNLSLFAKLWVESKSVGFDVSGFMFYALVRVPTPSTPTQRTTRSANAEQSPKAGVKVKKEELSEPSDLEDISGNEELNSSDQDLEDTLDAPNRIVGYFSKEKNSWDNNNLACILVLPPWQSKGIGQLLIQASYYLGQKEGRFGGPERPLSASGKSSYETYWSRVVAESVLRLSKENKPTIQEVAEDAWIVPDDVIVTLEKMEWIQEFVEGEADAEGQQQKIVTVNRGKVAEWLEEKGRQEGLEEDGWLFEEGESEEDEDEDEDEVSDSEDDGELDDEEEDEVRDGDEYVGGE